MIHKMAALLEILFRRVSVERILCEQEENKIYYDELKKSYLQDLLLTYYQQYSDTEIWNQIAEIQLQIDAVGENMDLGNKPGRFHVFSVLFSYVEDILVFHENRVVCRYDKLPEWYRFVKAVGEDLPVLARQVRRDHERGEECQNFAWAPIISHNSNQLKRILEKGMADNHFHLRVSSPYFYISWMNLMNHPARTEILSLFAKIEKNYRDKNKKSEVGIKRESLRNLVAKAALIRIYLCCRLENITLDSTFLNTLEKLLSDDNLLETNIEEIQGIIDSMPGEGMDIDYMLEFAPNRYFKGEEEYWILSGERYFLYRMLKKILAKDIMFKRWEYNLFYAYLRIKNELRCELVQANDIAGFENFQIYQSRKDYFSHIGNSEKYEKLLTRLAVKDVLMNPAVQFLEVRISPKISARENAEYIQQCDYAVTRAYSKDEEFFRMLDEIREGFGIDEKMKEFEEGDLRKRFYYVFHFPKKEDEIMGAEGFLECRHFHYRRLIEKKAEAILNLRKEYPQYGRRVVGIDACSQEIGCRPEVFGRVFRTLKNYINPYPDAPYNYELPQLKVTYHVGEEFLDITDGLRAIEEAIRFLKLDCGDRLGHAIALGTDIEKWYCFKENQITLPLQDYLDNIVWFHHALIRYDIKDMGSLMGWLEEQYSYYFAYIYQPYIQELKHFDADIERWQFEGRVDILTYYLSWLLRGDEPELYKSGTFMQREGYQDQWCRYEVNNEKLRKDDIRRIPEVTLMYHMYHYNREVRMRGSERKTFSVHEKYRKGLIQVQKAMREDIVSRGIGIETNPSSNVNIGVIQDYAEHPIKNFYNVDLTQKESELMECSQMNVSINTDDKGIFSTRLENEYALLASALEKETNPDGTKRYKRECIYKWLDNIREMGLRQAFGNDVPVRR